MALRKETHHGRTGTGGVIVELKRGTDLQRFGSKAVGLVKLMEKGFNVPRTWVVPTYAYLAFLDDPQTVRVDLEKAVSSSLDPNKKYAIRSSANIEDLESRSYAGQFSTFLNVRGKEEIIDAVVKVWESAATFSVKQYSDRMGGDVQKVLMAVLVQEMVSQVISGVSFSMDPVTGVQRPVVEAVKGSGELLVQKGADTARWEDGLVTGALWDIDEGLLAKSLWRPSPSGRYSNRRWTLNGSTTGVGYGGSRCVRSKRWREDRSTPPALQRRCCPARSSL
ncbi:MAG: hypothetical protein HPY73_03295 [Methanomassiliicoccales archaeon]|nr:MAG: hypothetical protein HPY73_03295 [Methanomassiliicoccales archaeon]